MESNEVIAPFVMKTYQMVNDSSLDNLIRWGKSNSSFIVVDSLDFSQRLLPAFFKHNNFSSFIRQLNTYGFKKVNPDRWEFANEWFLRGQVRLLKNICRKRQTCRSKYSSKRFDQDHEEEDEDEKEMIIEIARLKQEQKVLEQEVVSMNKRIEAIERRPEQMMALLCKVAEDPEILHRMMLEKVQRSKRLVYKKQQRRLTTTQLPLPPSSSSNSIKCEMDEYCEIIGEGMDSSPEGCFGHQIFRRSPPSAVAPVPVWLWNKDGGGDGDDGCGFSVERITRYENNSEGGGGLVDPDGRQSAPPYPFSLLGGGF